MRKLIINADDFGISESVNDGIIELLQMGIVTSTSIMANGNAFDQAVKRCHENPNFDIGIHLTLVEEKPILSPEKIPSLVNTNGYLHQTSWSFAQKYFTTQINLNEIEIELGAQIEKVLNNGINISHIDSHQHLHMFPKVFDIVVQLGAKYGINAMRIPMERIYAYLDKSQGKVFRLLQQMILNYFCRIANKKTGFKSPDHFFGYFYGGYLNKDNLAYILNNIPENGFSELMCHPGYAPNDDYYDHWKYNWVEEFNALKDTDIKELIISRNIELLTYKDL